MFRVDNLVLVETKSAKDSRKKRGQAHLPDHEVIGEVPEVFDRRAFKLGIYRATERGSQVGKVGLPPLLTIGWL